MNFSRLSTSKNWVLVLFLILFVALLLLPGLGKSFLWDRDETFYAETAREMLATGNYAIPSFNGTSFLEKPPFAYWMMVGSFRLFGVGEFAARFPSVLFGIGTVLLTFFLGNTLFDRKTGIFSSLILSTSLFFLVLGRAAITDTYLLFFFTGSLLFFFLGREKRYCYPISYGLMGLAVLTKGPIGFLLPAVIILLFLFFNKELKQLKMHLPLGFVVFLLIVSPWYLAIMKSSGGKFFSEFILRQHLYRFIHPMQSHYGPFYYYLPVLILGLFPWSVFLPGALWSKRGELKSQKYGFLIIWMIVVFIFFSLSQTKLPHYILPLFPPSSILIAKLWAKEETTFLKPSLLILLGMSILLLLLPISLFWIKPNLASKALVINFFILVAGSGFAVLAYPKVRGIFSSLVITMLCFALFFSLKSVPEVNSFRIIAPLAKLVEKRASPSDSVFSFRYFEPSMVFYTQHFVKRIDSLSELEEGAKGEKKIFCFIRKKDYETIKDKADFVLLAKKEGLSENKGEMTLLLLGVRSQHLTNSAIRLYTDFSRNMRED